MTDIVHVGAKLLAAYPGWKPFSNPEELTFVDNETLKVTKTNGYNSASELIKFTFDKNNHVESVNFCGSTMLPEKIWHTKQAGKKIISIFK